jgi:GT2 family glycosyltransferase
VSGSGEDLGSGRGEADSRDAGRRPPVSVVMPFAGDADQLRAALGALAALRTGPGDELILAFNGGCDPPAGAMADQGRLRIVIATRERSPAHARNAGAAVAAGDWLLFIDADTIAPADLIERYFACPPGPSVGALAGEIVPATAAGTLAGRYAAQRNFLRSEAHLAHPYLPRAAAANLLVRRAAFAAIGGFHEGLRAGEDTDLCWRLQRAGWRLEHRPAAVVEHRYRHTLGELRRQWRAYAAGRTWLARRHPGFRPQPAAARALAALVARARSAAAVPAASVPAAAVPAASIPWSSSAPPFARAGAPRSSAPRRSRGPAPFIALDVLLAGEELVGLALANRPPVARRATPPASGAVRVVVAGEFPAPGVTLSAPARVEAGWRPRWAKPPPADLAVIYREDDGALERLWAVLALAACNPRRVLFELRSGDRSAPSLWLLAPAAWRLAREPEARVEAVDETARPGARRLARLAGRDHPAG